MASLQHFQSQWDNLDPSDFDNNYSESLDEEVKDPEIAVKNLKNVLFEEGGYIDEGKLWESIRCLSDYVGSPIKGNCPKTGVTVVKTETLNNAYQMMERSKKEVRDSVERHLITIKEALYGSEKVNEYSVNMAIKNLEYMFYGYPIESKKITITRKG